MGRDAKRWREFVKRYGWEICERVKVNFLKIVINFNLLKKHGKYFYIFNF